MICARKSHASGSRSMSSHSVVDALSSSREIAVAAHVQRLCLELPGFKTYLEVVLARPEIQLNFSELVFNVAGVFLSDSADMQTWWRMAPLLSWVFEHLGCICQHSAFSVVEMLSNIRSSNYLGSRSLYSIIQMTGHHEAHSCTSRFPSPKPCES